MKQEKPKDRVLHIKTPEIHHRFLRIKAAELSMSVTKYVNSLIEKAMEKEKDK